MYELRELVAAYFGLYLFALLILFVFLKLLNPTRFQSMVFFWERASSNAELNKPFNQKKAFSFVGFVLRAFMFGLVAQVFISKNLSPATFTGSLLWWAGGFMLFWMAKTLIEGGLISIFGQQEGLLKLFYVRTIFKEKWAFLFSCLTIMLVHSSLSPIAAQILALSYALGLIVIHLRFLRLYFRRNPIKKVYIILYICASEIGPVWLLIQTLKL